MALTRKPKSVRIAIRIGVEESDMLNELIERTGMLASDVIRQAVRSYYFASQAEGATVNVLGVKLTPAELATIAGTSRKTIVRDLRSGAPVETILQRRVKKTVDRAISRSKKKK